ncbi:adenosylmethionine--8-amino-7-oxononanoate transaminase [Allonocardiopsis opalescens]|uniref:Adenosylmethionine-8-amino-7-oxononanoate aminotransferase n=1 Tax=Allonocardiopsis opalescens TaxID=1144618 RepID=A0A2T0QCN3_9ACTN|nr:adenosylmethionine--8-amino-7-oxononanoate transaminase [Allonocardiopsis opalescens]PRY01613.1 adenosylmethionine-8-amino-7-oxononanoate aminotransferase [Allonocardiopsis opalescens]
MEPPLPPDRIADLLARDRARLWHPYAGRVEPPEVLPVVAAEGVRLRLADGTRLVDGMSSWWAAVHGYNHPVLNAAVREQLDRMAHVMFGGLTHPPAVALAERLAELAPGALTEVFLADSGSVAVEVAIKTALQYWMDGGGGRRTRLLTVRGGYHGDTFGAMAVCDPVGGMHHLFRHVLPEHVFVSAPPPGYGAEPDPAYLAEIEAALERHGERIAAVILEPVVQGAGGMRFYAPGYLRGVRELCDRFGVLLIADEIATGFGRTGRLFGCDHAGIAPDIMCLGKALTGGYLTMSAVLTTRAVAERVDAGAGALMHGPTFMANPLAASVALASVDLLLATDWRRKVAGIEERLRTGLAPAAALPGVRDVRVLGAIGVVQLDRPVDVAAATRAAVAHGVWLRPFRDLVYTMPPFVTGADDVDAIAAAMLAAVRAG